MNHYRLRRTEKPGTCWICRKESALVLVAGENLDWFYTCATHIADASFCREVSVPGPAPASAASNPNSNAPDAPASSSSSNGTVTPDALNTDGEKKSVSLFDMFDKSYNIIKPPSSPPQPTQAEAVQAAVSVPRYFKLDEKIFFMRGAEKKSKPQARQQKSSATAAKQLSELNSIRVPQSRLQ
ncbi:hypothetical protein BJ741DRAFT_598125 [Chytriomyces cf. hyalinus JEL632]|nr:hypothetical protein BJ741DRAFT_598125 [Chytriomyces cf. hyalinus JEL632]